MNPVDRSLLFCFFSGTPAVVSSKASGLGFLVFSFLFSVNSPIDDSSGKSTQGRAEQ